MMKLHFMQSLDVANLTCASSNAESIKNVISDYDDEDLADVHVNVRTRPDKYRPDRFVH